MLFTNIISNTLSCLLHFNETKTFQNIATIHVYAFCSYYKTLTIENYIKKFNQPSSSFAF